MLQIYIESERRMDVVDMRRKKKKRERERGKEKVVKYWREKKSGVCSLSLAA